MRITALRRKLQPVAVLQPVITGSLVPRQPWKNNLRLILRTTKFPVRKFLLKSKLPNRKLLVPALLRLVVPLYRHLNRLIPALKPVNKLPSRKLLPQFLPAAWLLVLLLVPPLHLVA